MHGLEPRLRAGGTAYLDSGPGAADAPGRLPLVLVHGVGMNAQAWGPQVAAFAPRRRVIALDMPGHGASALPPEHPTLADYAGRVVALLDALGLGRVVLAGHSMGGLVALATALAAPARIAGLIVLNSVYGRTPEQRAAVLARAGQLVREGGGATRGQALARWFGDPPPPHLVATAQQVGAWLDTVDPLGYARTYALFARGDAELAGRLGAIACPALFLTGTDDPNSTPAMARAMAAAVPSGRAMVLPGERHMMALAAPERVNAVLHAFLDEVAP